MKQHYVGRTCYIVRFIPRYASNESDYVVDCNHTGFPDPSYMYRPTEFNRGCPLLWNEFDCDIVATRVLFHLQECNSLLDKCKSLDYYNINKMTLESYMNKSTGHYSGCDPNPINSVTRLTKEQITNLLEVWEDYEPPTDLITYT